MTSIFVAARQDAALDRRVGTSFWLAPEQERTIRKQYLSQVQSFAGRTVSEDDFAVRGMLVANTQRDYYYSRFSRESLAEAAELLPGAPAMYGHDYRSQPVGRIFHARVTRIENPDQDARDQHWLEALYYVPRDDAGEAHLRRVDLGIFREVSFGWRCAGQSCSVCGDEIQRCPHIPGDIYDERGFCEYEFSGITAALEVSHVYRGGQKDTTTFVPPTEPGASNGASGESVSMAAGRSFMRSCPPGSRDIDPALLIEAKRVNGALVNDLDAFLHTENGQRAVDLFGFTFGQPGQRANTQTIRINNARFTSPTGAKRWAREHDFRVDKNRVAGMDYEFEQQRADRFAADSFREITLDRGVRAVVGKPATRDARTAVDPNAGSLDAWLSEQAGAAQ